MPNIQQLSDVRRTVDIPFDTVDVKITYRLTSINNQLSAWVDDHSDDRAWLMGWVERVVIEWDITDGDAPVPVAVEAMERYGPVFSTPLLRLILDTILKDSDPNVLRESYKRTSPTGTAVARNGTKPS